MQNLTQRYWSPATFAGRRPAPPISEWIRKAVTVEETTQKLATKEDIVNIQELISNLSTVFVNNIAQLVYSILIAQGPINFQTLRCTEDGALYVAQTDTALDAYEVIEGTAGDNFTTKNFSQQVKVLDVFIYDNPAIIQISRDLVADFGGDIEIWKDAFYSVSALVRRVKIKNKTAGSNARYKLVGWYKA
ncbi:MAG: hypothetical protein DRI93_03275 [Aquificota bacterium]|nr:MAG: hypothetical protein DRJ03_14760 [Chloroflexota bacterium]RLD94928.1 MAG: hypothetical protein DRI93_03275 [Aquificota bacterium]